MVERLWNLLRGRQRSVDAFYNPIQLKNIERTGGICYWEWSLWFKLAAYD
jgi:hypothetical protein